MFSGITLAYVETWPDNFCIIIAGIESKDRSSADGKQKPYRLSNTRKELDRQHMYKPTLHVTNNIKKTEAYFQECNKRQKGLKDTENSIICLNWIF